MADLFNSDSDSDIEPASAEARGAVLDQLRRQADETFARGPVVGPTAIELHWRRVGRAFAEVTLSLASAGSYTLRWSVPGVATPRARVACEPATRPLRHRSVVPNLSSDLIRRTR